MNRFLAISIALVFTIAAPALARGHHSYYHRIHRSAEARDEFERMTGFPHGRRGYVIDHIVPLACGGADAPANMQWQTVADAKAKDKWERKGCTKAKR